MGIIAWIVLGLIVGAIARAILKDEGSWGSNLILGVAGGIVGGWLGQLIFDVGIGGFFDIRTWVLAIVGAVVVSVVWGALTGKKK